MGIMKHGHDASRGSNANHDRPIATSPSETSPSKTTSSKTTPSEETRGQSKGYALIAVVYLLGLIMGALDMSIVNPARTVIQNTMSVNDALGVWVITIYTLAYAAAIPVMGKLADRHGRKSVYLLCILLFGGGSLLCGLARFTDSFELLLAARVIQAIGGGGIMPVATAEFGTAFPEEKRGMALGMVGMVYGLSSILGPSVGSGILDIFGQTEWQYIFFINVPICLIVLILGIAKLPQSKAEHVKPIDGLGTLLLTAMTLSIMYGLKNIDFFNLAESVASTDVWPYLLIFLLLLPLFILREKRAVDPILNPNYFTNRNIVITLICSIISGIIMMGTIFFPQFCENAMMMKSGSGGYFIAILGIGTAIGSMASGRLIDKHGVKPVLGAGFVGAAIGSVFMAFVACEYPNLVTVCLSMFLSGAGLGFTMGTPLNYMMLNNTEDAESNSALATMSLVRSIGTAVAPAIMVAFIVHASVGMQDTLMNALPKQVSVSPLPYAAQIDQKLDDMRADEDTAEMLEGLDIPKLSDYQSIDVSMNSEGSDFDVEISDELLEKMENSDVTTIVGVCKEMTSDIFSQVKPKLISQATEGMESGLVTMQEKAQEMHDGLNDMQDGINEMNTGLNELSSSISEMDSNISDANNKISTMKSALAGIKEGINQMQGQIASMKQSLTSPGIPDEKKTEVQAAIDQMNAKIAAYQTQVTDMESAINGITKGRDGMESGRAEMQSARTELVSARAELTSSHAELQQAYDSLCETIAQLEEADAAIPGLFNEAETNYLASIDDNAEQIQKVYQQTLNGGFRGMAIFVAIIALIGLLVLIPYKDNKPGQKNENEAQPYTL